MAFRGLSMKVQRCALSGSSTSGASGVGRRVFPVVSHGSCPRSVPTRSTFSGTGPRLYAVTLTRTLSSGATSSRSAVTSTASPAASAISRSTRARCVRATASSSTGVPAYRLATAASRDPSGATATSSRRAAASGRRSCVGSRK